MINLTSTAHAPANSILSYVYADGEAEKLISRIINEGEDWEAPDLVACASHTIDDIVGDTFENAFYSEVPVYLYGKEALLCAWKWRGQYTKGRVILASDMEAMKARKDFIEMAFEDREV